MTHRILCLLCICFAISSISYAEDGFQLRSDRGKVEWLADVLEREQGVKVVPDARERILAMHSKDGELLPLLEDIRGRAFRKDKRLREMDLELLSRQHDGSPMLQVVRVYQWQDGKRYEVDYWCEICAIAMFELKACDCCQGPIELRRREVAADGEPLR